MPGHELLHWERMKNHKASRIARGFKWKKSTLPLILFLTKKDWGSCSLRMAQAIRKYTDWDAACVSYWGANVLPTELQAKYRVSPEIRALMIRADVIIYGASWYGWNPHSVKINPNAYIGVWHIGSGYRVEHELYAKDCHPKIDFAFCSGDLLALETGVIRLPVAYDVESFEIPSRLDSPIIIGHSPSGRGSVAAIGRSMKGTKYLLKAIEMLKKVYGDKIQLDVIQDETNYNRCLSRKSVCHIFYDSIQVHSNSKSMHGISTIEAAAYGSVCLCCTDFHDSPIIDVKNTQDIYNAIRDVIDNKKLEKLGKETKEWALKQHGYESVAKRLISIIEEKMLEV